MLKSNRILDFQQLTFPADLVLIGILQKRLSILHFFFSQNQREFVEISEVLQEKNTVIHYFNSENLIYEEVLLKFSSFTML